MTDDQNKCIESGDSCEPVVKKDFFTELSQNGLCEASQALQAPKALKEELYIGCKVIKAIPMSSDDFKKFKGQEIGMEENAPGYKVEYEDGYVSWSPAWTFENAYRKLSTGERKLLFV